jgi:plastocyanin
VLEDLWNEILKFTQQFVMPDWAGLIQLIPVGLTIVVGIWLILLVRRFATAGPTRRGKRRVTPLTPAGIHMPGPSFAPLLAAVGAFLLFLGLVVGGTALLLGAIAMVLTLLVWGAEALRDYDHHGDGAAETLPAVVHDGPPPGVHMPGPSFRPVLAALGAAILFFGIVFGGWLLIVGIVLLIATLLGWLVDARKEYVKTVEADETGHLENIPEPHWPRRLLWIGALLVALALLADNGIFPPRSSSGTAAGGGPGASPAAGGGTPSGSGGTAPSGSPSGPAASLPAADVQVVAEGIKFTTADVSATGPDFTIAFDNKDDSVPHDIVIQGADGSRLFAGEAFPGPAVKVYDVTGIQPGTYTFICSIHPNMTGTIAVQ